MNKKNIILVSKACLLLSMLGFCIPVFDEANGFAALIYFLGAGEGALYVSIGIALILCFLAMAASILFSSLYFIRGKNENHTKQTAATDWALMGLIILTSLFSFIAVTILFVFPNIYFDSSLTVFIQSENLRFFKVSLVSSLLYTRKNALLQSFIITYLLYTKLML